jgi:hypothetical protein
LTYNQWPYIKGIVLILTNVMITATVGRKRVKNLRSTPIFNFVRVAQSLVFRLPFCISLFVPVKNIDSNTYRYWEFGIETLSLHFLLSFMIFLKVSILLPNVWDWVLEHIRLTPLKHLSSLSLVLILSIQIWKNLFKFVSLIKGMVNVVLGRDNYILQIYSCSNKTFSEPDIIKN